MSLLTINHLWKRAYPCLIAEQRHTPGLYYPQGSASARKQEVWMRKRQLCIGVHDDVNMLL